MRRVAVEKLIKSVGGSVDASGTATCQTAVLLTPEEIDLPPPEAAVECSTPFGGGSIAKCA